MNNDHYRTVDKNFEEDEAHVSETKLVVSLGRLVRNRDWKIVCDEYFTPRLNGARERADTLEGAELHRFQGEIRILKMVLNLQTALIAQQNTIEHAQEEIGDGYGS